MRGKSSKVLCSTSSGLRSTCLRTKCCDRSTALELGEVRRYLVPFYSATGRLSVAPELLIRMLIVGYCSGIRSERRLCEEVHLNLVPIVGGKKENPVAADGAFRGQSGRCCS